MNLEKLQQQAIKDFYELKEIVDNTDLSLEELCDELGGHNLSDELFDLNYKSICATIYFKNNKLSLHKSVELWDDKNCELVDWNFIIEY